MIDKRNYLKSHGMSELSGDRQLNEQLSRNSEHKSYIEKTDFGYLYKCEFLVGKFRPTEFRIKLRENNLTVEASREHIRASDLPETSMSSIDANNVYYDNNNVLNNNNNNRYNYLNFKEIESFKREINVPMFVDLDSLNCYLETYENFQNVLVVEGLIDKRFQYDEYFDGVGPQHATFEPDLDRIPKSEKIRIMQEKNSPKFGPARKIENSNSNHSLSSSSGNNSGYLKYKFDLSEYDSNNITITVRNKTILNVNAHKVVFDPNGHKQIEQFNHDIRLPDNVQIHNIKNCFDENDGILRIEIPLDNLSNSAPTGITSSFSNSSQPDSAHNNNSNVHNLNSHRRGKKAAAATSASSSMGENEKYLELMFDLYDFKFDKIDVRTNSENKKILIVRALKMDEDGRVESKPYLRKYILPDWVDCENIIVNTDKQIIDGEVKNLLIVQISIKE